MWSKIKQIFDVWLNHNYYLGIFEFCNNYWRRGIFMKDLSGIYGCSFPLKYLRSNSYQHNNKWILTTLMSWMKASPNATWTFCVMFCTGLMSLLYPLKRSLTSLSSSREPTPETMKNRKIFHVKTWFTGH